MRNSCLREWKDVIDTFPFVFRPEFAYADVNIVSLNEITCVIV